MTKSERIRLAIFTVAYLLAWVLFAQNRELSEVGQLLLSAPFLFCFVWLIAAPDETH